MFRFTIRDVLWLMVVVALGVCWYSSHQRATHFKQGYDDFVQKKKAVEDMRYDAIRKLQESAAAFAKAKAERDEAVKYWRDTLVRPPRSRLAEPTPLVNR